MTGVTKKSKGYLKEASETIYRSATYGMVLARGGSYMVSSLTLESRIKQLAETVGDFRGEFGPTALPRFLKELENWLLARGERAGAQVVAYYREHGTMPPLPVPVDKAAKRRVRVTEPRKVGARAENDEEAVRVAA
jgi:hypothetical protein